jgi:hypothetical protein
MHLTRAVEDGMKFGFVDPDDDEVTETLEGYEGPGRGWRGGG